MQWTLTTGQAGRRAAVLAIATVCVAGAACSWKGDRGSNLAAAPVFPEGWSTRPTRMRVYPTTRFSQEGGHSILEAHIELFDEMGDSVKGVGRFRMELLTRARGSDQSMGDRLYTWDVDMLTLADQQRHWDPITRTYWFRLKLDDLPSTERGTLFHVQFLLPDGGRLDTRSVLGVSSWTDGWAPLQPSGVNIQSTP